MLSVILTRATGEKEFDYLATRLFAPLGIENIYWDEIDGCSAGGFGCNITLDVMAKVGQLFLQNGRWEGHQIISEEWLRVSTAFQIDSTENNVLADWRQGYCYQMWRCAREGCYRADGAFGQYILVLPPQNMIVAIWSEDAYSQDMLDCLYEEVYDKLDERVYTPDGASTIALQNEILLWETPVVQKPTSSWKEAQISGRPFSVKNDSALWGMTFTFDDAGRLRFEAKHGYEVTTILAGNTLPVRGADKLCFEAASFIRLQKEYECEFPYAASYEWLSDRVLRLHIVWTGLAHSTDITILFGDRTLTADFSVSYEKYLLPFNSSTPALNIKSQTIHAALSDV